jgi:malate dehydrogenase (oxaloacetate-decarboxylating)
LVGADVFIGVSAPNLLSGSDILRMAADPIVFALANPDPEVPYEEVEGVARIIATGRSDYPNQVNNVLAFPGIFRGALDCRARRITEGMKVAAARAISEMVGADELAEDYIIPSAFNRDVAPSVAAAVAEAARAEGVAQR